MTLFGGAFSDGFSDGFKIYDGIFESLDATDITRETALLNGIVTESNLEGLKARFNWGKTEELGNNTDWKDCVVGEVFSELVEGLDSSKTYNFRVEIYDGYSYYYSEGRTFTTYNNPVYIGEIIRLKSAIGRTISLKSSIGRTISLKSSIGRTISLKSSIGRTISLKSSIGRTISLKSSTGTEEYKK